MVQAGEQDHAAVALARYALEVAEQAAGLQTRTGEQAATCWLDAEDATMGQAGPARRVAAQVNEQTPPGNQPVWRAECPAWIAKAVLSTPARPAAAGTTNGAAALWPKLMLL